jgi:DNA-directed RNA polymerase subunit RPC12/RpoP
MTDDRAQDDATLRAAIDGLRVGRWKEWPMTVDGAIDLCESVLALRARLREVEAERDARAAEADLMTRQRDQREAQWREALMLLKDADTIIVPDAYAKLAAAEARVAQLELEVALACARLQKAEHHLREIARSCHTLSPQEFVNHAAAGLGVDRHEYVGEVPANTSLYEMQTRARIAEARVAQLEAALYPLVTEGLAADASGDGPEYVNDEIYNGMRALPECGRCGATGATDRKQYEDEPIPDALVCPTCGGRGFLKHAAPGPGTPNAEGSDGRTD